MDSSKFKTIPGFPGYFASRDGDIYSEFSRKILRPGSYSNGYLFVNVKTESGKRFSGSVHRLVCLAFHGIPDVKMTASHLDGNRKNNKLDNLVWETLSDNHKRKVLHGTDDRGCKNSRAKIDKNTLTKIRNLLKGGELTHKKIGEKFNLGRVFITKIKNGHRYKENDNK